MKEQLMEKMKQYAKTFGDGFPTIPLAWDRTDEELIEIIDRCLAEKKDVYELGILTNDEDVKY